MKRSDLISLVFLFIAALLVYYPVFHADYLYSDECVQLWQGGKGLNFNTSVPQGRYITYKLFTGVFNSIHTIHGLIHARLFSLCGWLLCLPAWYFIIKDLVSRNGLPELLTPLSLVYLICMPPFAISIGWAACLELFIACTAGLVSGYALYAGLGREDNSRPLPVPAMAISLLFALLSLFTYQNGFGCFLIPFFIHFLAAKKITKNTLIGMVGCLLIYGIYYLLFRLTLGASGVDASTRSALSADPAGKLIFLFTRPLATAFHFTWLFDDRRMAGLILYIILAAAWLIAGLLQRRATPWREKFFYFAGLLVFFVLLYLPSLIVKEDYAANRTLLALDLAIFFLVAETLFALLKYPSTRYLVAVALAAFFLIDAKYNFNKGFLHPLTNEYQVIKDFVSLHVGPATTRVYFIRPPEEAFEKKYGIIASWDEFGLPSTAKPWVPEPLIRQLILERTGDRHRAEEMIVRNWPDKASFLASGDTIAPGTVLIDGNALLRMPSAFSVAQNFQ